MGVNWRIGSFKKSRGDGIGSKCSTPRDLTNIIAEARKGSPAALLQVRRTFSVA